MPLKYSPHKRAWYSVEWRRNKMQIDINDLRKFCIKEYDMQGNNIYPESCLEGKEVFNELLYYLNLNKIISNEEQNVLKIKNEDYPDLPECYKQDC
jgi:hypothetical protein